MTNIFINGMPQAVVDFESRTKVLLDQKNQKAVSSGNVISLDQYQRRKSNQQSGSSVAQYQKMAGYVSAFFYASQDQCPNRLLQEFINNMTYLKEMVSPSDAQTHVMIGRLAEASVLYFQAQTGQSLAESVVKQLATTFNTNTKEVDDSDEEVKLQPQLPFQPKRVLEMQHDQQFQPHPPLTPRPM